MDDNVQAFWKSFLEGQPGDPPPETYSAWSFGNTPEMADSLGDLALKGIKSATTSLAWIYEKFPDEKMPVVGEYSIILDSAKQPLCIVKTSSVTTRKFSEIDEEYARTEGEGDGSLKYWKDVHWRYFLGECKLVEREPHEDMPVVCEIFEVVYPPPSPSARRKLRSINTRLYV